LTILQDGRELDCVTNAGLVAVACLVVVSIAIAGGVAVAVLILRSQSGHVINETWVGANIRRCCWRYP
jgi:hypothetical protein